MNIRIICIVEGHGDVKAVPILIRRVIQNIAPALYVDIPTPIRVPKTRLVRPGELERAVELAARRAVPGGGVFILLDSDDECPAQAGPDLLARARAVRQDIPLALVLAKREFEAWFLAAAESLRRERGLADNLIGPERPEDIRGAKEWLSRHMTADHHYVETLDQPALAARFDLHQARRADSFDKCYREIEGLTRRLLGETTP